uniref:B30.2/SPRY domain-containing protein n=2 Tax=Meloidogyne TaxID=189290 RepID=A0A914KV78_MELIC
MLTNKWQILLARSTSSSGSGSCLHATTSTAVAESCSSFSPEKKNTTKSYIKTTPQKSPKHLPNSNEKIKIKEFQKKKLKNQQKINNPNNYFIDDELFGSGKELYTSGETETTGLSAAQSEEKKQRNRIVPKSNGTNKYHHTNKAFQYSPPPLSHHQRQQQPKSTSTPFHLPRRPFLPTPFIAWPPVPISPIKQSLSSSPRRNKTSPLNKQQQHSPLRQLLHASIKARNILLSQKSSTSGGEYSRFPESEEAGDSVEEEQSSTSTRRANKTRQPQPQQRQILQQRIRHRSRSISLRPLPLVCPLIFHSSFLEAHQFQEMCTYKLDVILQMPELPLEEAEKYAWNSEDHSVNVYVKPDDKLTMHRHPVAQSSDAIRAKIGFSRGFHVWQIIWPVHQRGTHAAIGVVTKKASLRVAGYSSLIGNDEEGYGWNIVDNKCYHDSANTKGWVYPMQPLQISNGQRDQQQITSFQTPEKIYCILDMDEGKMSFATDSSFLGTAFCGLKGKKLYPAVSAVWGHCEVTIRYIGGLDPEPRQLMDICRRRIRLALGTNGLARVSELNVPPPLKQYLLYN